MTKDGTTQLGGQRFRCGQFGRRFTPALELERESRQVVRRIPLVVLGPRPARVGYAFLLWAVVLVTVGQWLLVAVPSVPMPLALTEAFKPVWPNTAPALLAVVLFLVSLTLFVLGLRRLLPEPVVRAADWPTPNWGTWLRSDAGLVGLGTGLTLVLVLLLAATPYATW